MKICQSRNCTKEVPSTRRKDSIYCSVFCSKSENDRRSKEKKIEERKPKICAFCKIKEVPKGKDNRCKYCSDDCSRSAINAQINGYRKVKIAKEKVVKKEKESGIDPFYLKRHI